MFEHRSETIMTRGRVRGKLATIYYPCEEITRAEVSAHGLTTLQMWD